jgi:hypothetical protein
MTTVVPLSTHCPEPLHCCNTALYLVFDAAGDGVIDGVIDGVLDGVMLGIVEQSVTVLTVPDASKVIAYLTPPSINSENPPGFDV